MLRFTFFDSAEWATIGASERFVSEETYKTQQKLKDDYMQRDQKHMEIISKLRKQLEEMQDYIKNLEGRINNQKKVINKMKEQKDEAVEGVNMYNYSNMILGGKLEELENENKVLKARLKDAIGIDYTDSTDYIAQLHKNVLNQRKELRNLNKALERERKRNKELEGLYSSAQNSIAMLNMKVMELNQGIRDSEDLRWKEKYDELEEKWKEKYSELGARYTADSTSLNGVINELRKRLKNNNDQNNTTCKKLADDLAYITDRCAKAEHTIEAIKEALKEE